MHNSIENPKIYKNPESVTCKTTKGSGDSKSVLGGNPLRGLQPSTDC